MNPKYQLFTCLELAVLHVALGGYDSALDGGAMKKLYSEVYSEIQSRIDTRSFTTTSDERMGRINP